MKQPHINVQFNLDELGQEGLNKLFEIERKLRELGVNFDTGGGCGGRDWEWDWSLEGPIKLTLLEQLDVEEEIHEV